MQPCEAMLATATLLSSEHCHMGRAERSEAELRVIQPPAASMFVVYFVVYALLHVVKSSKMLTPRRPLLTSSQTGATMTGAMQATRETLRGARRRGSKGPPNPPTGGAGHGPTNMSRRPRIRENTETLAA